MASETQLWRLRQALASMGPEASSEDLYDWIESNWPRMTGFKGPNAVGHIRKRLQPGWGPVRSGRRGSKWEKKTP